MNDADPALADAIAAAEAEGQQRMRQGDTLAAFDCMTAARRSGLDSPTLRYLHVRALAALGDCLAALALYDELGLGDTSDVDSLSLAGRIRKDQAFASSGDARRHWLAEAAETYHRAFRLSGDNFPAINAASLFALLGQRDAATNLAHQIMTSYAGTEPGDYWSAAIAVEAWLLLGEQQRAIDASHVAARLGGADPADRASTCRQVARLSEAGAIDAVAATAVLGILRPDPVGVFCGRMFRAGGVGEANAARAIAAALDAEPLSALVGPLACGADILFAEAALARGIDLTIILPFDEEDFIAQSVLSGGAEWMPRYQRCRDGAARVRLASNARFVNDDGQFVLGSHTAMGLAMLRARELECPALQLAVVDPGAAARTNGSQAGTNADIALWQSHGGKTRSIAVGDLDRRLEFPPAPSPPEGTRRGLYAILFADYAGFSRLGEAELPIFARDVMGRIGTLLNEYGDDVLFRNTWGDAVYAVIANPLAAARIALAMQQRLVDLPPELGSPADGAGMRIGIHFGPIYRGIDRVVGTELWYGTEVTRTARIEPVTPTGHVYCTEPFAAMLALERREFACNYVGTVSLAKKYGELSLYRLSSLG